MSISAKIFEQGCGFPSEGDILLHNLDGRTFRVVGTDGRIHTGRAAGNFIYATIEETVSDAEPFEARVEIDD